MNRMTFKTQLNGIICLTVCVYEIAPLAINPVVISSVLSARLNDVQYFKWCASMTLKRLFKRCVYKLVSDKSLQNEILTWVKHFNIRAFKEHLKLHFQILTLFSSETDL